MLKELKKELREKNRLENLSKNSKRILEKAWRDDSNMVCEKCGKEDVTVDHIIPKDILRQFGIDVDREFWNDNLQILCVRCNQFKGNKLDFADKRTKKLLIHLLEKL